MIENYYYSIPRWKKVAFVILAGILIFCLCTARVNSSLFGWIAKNIQDNITQEIFDSLNATIAECVGKFLDALGNVFTEPFGPQLATFRSHTNLGSGTADVIIRNLSTWIGVFISTLIFGFALFVYFFSGKITDSKDTPISLLGKFILARAMIIKAQDIMDTILSIIDKIHTSYVTGAIGTVLNGSTDKFLSKCGESIDTYVTAKVTSVIPGSIFLIAIVVIIIVWQLVKGFFKLFAELVSRYILTVVLLMLFPAFAGTLVSNDTNQIFKSYLRTLFSSFFVLLFNIVWFKACVMSAVGMAATFSPLQFFFTIELLHFGLKIDGVLRSMGLGVATGGSRIASAVGGSGRNLANSLRTANGLRRSGGELAKGIGVASGNRNMFNIGNRLAATPADIASNRLNDPNSTFQLAAATGASGAKINDSLVDGRSAANIMSRAVNNPNDRDAQNALSALSGNALSMGAQEMLGNGYRVEAASISRIRGDDGISRNGIDFTAKHVGDGASFASAEASRYAPSITGTISGEGAFARGEILKDGINGASSSMICNNAMSKGDRAGIDDFASIGGTRANKAMDAINMDGFNGGIGSIESLGTNRNRDDCFRLRDSEGCVNGTIQGDKVFSAGTNDTATQQEMFSGIKEAIRSQGGFDRVDDFEPDPKRQGVYTASAYDPDGNEVRFTATDKGMYTDSSLKDDPLAFNFSGEDSYGNATSYDVNCDYSRQHAEDGNRGFETSDARFGDGSDGNNDQPSTWGDDSFDTSDSKHDDTDSDNGVTHNTERGALKAEDGYDQGAFMQNTIAYESGEDPWFEAGRPEYEIGYYSGDENVHGEHFSENNEGYERNERYERSEENEISKNDKKSLEEAETQRLVDAQTTDEETSDTKKHEDTPRRRRRKRRG